MKDCDVTWLYGPLQPGPVEPLRTLSLEDIPEDIPAISPRRPVREEILDLKPILKRRSVSEKMLVRSLLSASLLKQATAAVVAERSVRARSLPLLPLVEKHEYTKIPRPTSPALSRSSSTASLRPLVSSDVPDKKRIHFQEQVEQCIALENSESESDSRGAASDIESDFEDGVMSCRRPFSRTQRRSSRSAERRTKIIAKLPSTTLNCIDEDAELVNSRFWSKNSPPLSPSPRASSPSLSDADFRLDQGKEYIGAWSFDSNEDSAPYLHQNLTLSGNLPFPCLGCKDLTTVEVDQGKIFESRNDWLVHLWTVHQDPSTWSPTTCLWEGCDSSRQYISAASWLDHVSLVHHYDQQPELQSTNPTKDNSTTLLTGGGQGHDVQGGHELSRKVFGALATAKDIGSFLLQSASEPLSAHLEWLNRRSRAREASENDFTPRSIPLQSNDTQYFRNLARRILGMPIETHLSNDEKQDVDQEALVERLAETLSLYEVEINEEPAILDLDEPADVASNSPMGKQKDETARTSALYSMLISIRQSIIQFNPLSDDNAMAYHEGLQNSSNFPNGSDKAIRPSHPHSPDKDEPHSMVLPIRSVFTQEAMDTRSETDEEETTEYDSNEDIPSDASACGELSDTPEESTLDHDVLEPMRQALVDRVMDEFWIIFNQSWDSGYREHARGAQDSSSPSNASLATSAATTPLSTRPTQRKRQREDDMGSDDEDGNMSRKPKRSSGPSDEAGDRKRFACPFRKHDSRRYSTYNYRVCALSHWETIARVKYVNPFQTPDVELRC